MDANSIAVALGATGVVSSVIVAIAYFTAHCVRSRCIAFGYVVDAHVATAGELSGEPAAPAAQPQQGAVTVNFTTSTPKADT